MTWSLNRKATVAAALLMGLLLANLAVSVFSLNSVAHNEAAVSHAHEVLGAVSHLLSDMQDVETGQRGYLITGDETFLEPYNRGFAELAGGRARLEKLTADDAVQREILRRLDAPIKQKLQIVQESIDLRKSGQWDAVRHSPMLKRGKLAMDEIRRVIAEAEVHEQAVVGQRAAETGSSFRLAIVTFAAATAIGMGLLWVMLWIVQRDMNRRQQLSNEVHERGEKLAITLASIGDGVIVTDAEGRVVLLNAAAQKLTGWDQPSAAKRPLAEIFDIVNEETRAPVENPAMRALRDGVIVGLANHTILRGRDGSERPIDDSAAPIFDAARKLTGSVLVFRDISARKEAEKLLQRNHAELEALVVARTQQLKTNEEQFTLIVSNVQDYAIFMLDPQGRIQNWNLGAQRIKGYLAGEAVGKHFSMFYPQADLEAGKPAAELDAATRDGRCEDEGWRLRKDGSRFWANVVITALRDSSGVLRGFAKVTRDMTEKRKAVEAREHLLREQLSRAEAEKSNRLKDEFLAVVSHELRTPLTPILGWTSMLKHLDLKGPEFKHGLQVIESNVKAEVKLVEDLLDISRIISGKLKLELRPVGLAQVIESAMDVIRPSAQAKQIGLKFSMAESVGPIWGDPDRLQQIVWNLLSNAVKFTPLKGSVEIHLKRAGDCAEISVSDTGIGIPAGFLSRVFDRFSQADGTSTRHFGGLGIGLAIVRQLVESHGGKASAASPGEGKGATFTVRLPIHQELQRGQRKTTYPSGEIEEELAQLAGVRIFIVDDEPDARDFLTFALRRAGALTADAGSVAAAVAKIPEFKPDVILTDIGMPVEDGYALIGQLRRSGVETPVVALTAYARQEDISRTRTEGFQRHISKPVDADELCLVLKQVLKERGR